MRHKYNLLFIGCVVLMPSIKLRHPMAFLIFVTVMMLPGFHVTATVIRDRFRRYGDLDGYKCHEGFDLFQMEKRASTLACARHCSMVPECSGVFYQKDTMQCLGCNSQCDISNTSDTAFGTLFYKRDVCPSDESDWIGLPRGCSLIQFRKQSVPYSDAATMCDTAGAKLVKIDEWWKMDFITELIQICEDLTVGEYWVDGSNADAPNYLAPDAWRFSDGSLVPMDKYFWMTHAPNSPETHHCFRIVDSLWDDKDCSFPYWFICEK